MLKYLWYDPDSNHKDNDEYNVMSFFTKNFSVDIGRGILESEHCNCRVGGEICHTHDDMIMRKELFEKLLLIYCGLIVASEECWERMGS
jgi:hypothetical protein